LKTRDREGFGDIEGTGPPSEGEGGEGGDGGENLSEEEKAKRFEEVAKMRKEVEEKTGIDMNEPLPEDKPVTQIGN